MPVAFWGVSLREPSTFGGNGGALASSDPVDNKCSVDFQNELYPLMNEMSYTHVWHFIL